MSSASVIFRKLSRRGEKFTNEDGENPHEIAISANIDEFMKQALMEKGEAIAYYVNLGDLGPDVNETARKAAEHICKSLTTNESETARDYCSNFLDKPFVFVSCTKNHTKTNDIPLWNSLVLLPKIYKTLQYGRWVKREKFCVYFVDFCIPNDFSNCLKKYLTSQNAFSQGNESSLNEVRLHTFCREEDIEIEHLEINQLHDSDSGWWSCYCSLMTVYFGNVAFYRNIRGKPISSMPIRKVMPLSSSDFIRKVSDVSTSEINSYQKDSYKCHDGHSLGNVYKLSLAMLVLKQATELDLEFKVATEFEDDGKFDDLSIEFFGERSRKYYVQAKCKDNVDKKITYQNLESKKSIYYLSSYFNSFCEIKKKKLEEIKGRAELQKSWDESRFIISTTLGLDEADMKLHSITVTEVEDVNWLFNLSNVTLMKCYRIEVEDEGRCAALFPQMTMSEGGRNISEVKEFLGKLLFIVTQKGEIILKEVQRDMEKKCGPQTGKDIYEKFHNGVWDWMSKRNAQLRRQFFSSKNNPYKSAFDYFMHSIWFGLNAPVNSFVGRGNELKALHDHLQKKENEAVMIVQQQVIVSSLGGIGKSELARKYAHDYREFYGNKVIWINAEKGSIIESFELLAEHLNIAMRYEYGGKKNIEQVLDDVYKWFMHKTCLFIFDNAEEFNEIIRYLPKRYPNRRKPYVLVTTRNRELFKEQENGLIGKLELGVLPKDNAVEFVKNTLKIKDVDQDEEILDLVRMLGCLPLALQHAVAYIRESNFEKKLKEFINIFNDIRDEGKKLFAAAECIRESNMKMNIKEYIKIFNDGRDEAKKLFNSKGLDSYSATIFVTYGITLEKIKKDPIALEILYLISYFASDNIPKSVFLKLPRLSEFGGNHGKQRSEMSLNRAVNELRKYSLIEVNAEGTMIGIHRLLQQVIRLTLEDDEYNILSKAITLINNCDRLGRYQSHITLIWCYSSFQSKLVNEFYFKDNSISRYLHSSATPLHLLARNGSFKEVESLLLHIINSQISKLSVAIGAQDKYNRTPLYMAAEGDHLNIVKLLVSKGASCNTKSTMYYSSSGLRYVTDWTPIFIATFNGCYDVVVYLVNECKVDVNLKDSHNRKPAVIAAHAGHLPIVRFLTQSLNPSIQNKYLLHAEIQYSAICGKTEQLSEFLEALDEGSRKEVFNFKLGDWTALNLVASKGYLEIAEILLKSGAVIRRDKFNPLHLAASSGQLDVAKLLIKNGADPKDVTEEGWTSLHAAAQNGHLKVVKYFIEELAGDKHIDIDIRDYKKDTPLHTASFHGNLHVVKYLLDKGAELNVSNIFGATPLTYACFTFKRDIILYLLQRQDIIIDTMDVDQNSLLSLLHITPLHFAAGYGDLETVKFLVEKKNMEVDVGKNEWCTPLHFAAVFANRDIIRYLKEKGSDINTVAEIKKLKEVLEATKIALEVLSCYAKYFGFIYTFMPSFLFSLSSNLRSTPNACSSSLDHYEPLLEEGSKEQGFLANKILSSRYAKNFVEDLKYYMERGGKETGINASLFHSLLNRFLKSLLEEIFR